MPYLWLHNKVAVEAEELVPHYWNVLKSLQSELARHKNKPYGVKKLQSGGNGRKLLIDYDTLPTDIQQDLGDPRKEGHLLERYYAVKDETIRFYAGWKRQGKPLTDEEIDRYVINATTLQALVTLESERLAVRQSLHKKSPTKGLAQSLLTDALSFNETLPPSRKHSLPESLRHFKNAFKAFKNEGLLSVIKDPYGKGKQNARKVDERVIEVLKGLFVGQEYKPTPTDIARQYDSFLSGYIEVFNKETGELYAPEEFPALSESTIKAYLSAWETKIATYSLRSGNRQAFMGQFIPYAQTELPTKAGSLLSIDDRQPPFWYDKGKRLWFYIGIDVASRCMTAFVYGKTKEGIILEFYRQLVRNYHQWGLKLPFELECESSLNSSFLNTFLREGYMFQKVRVEANNARGKYIERMFGKMRNNKEKYAEGWIARPFAKSEANQAGKGATKIIPYNELVQARLADIEDWNNEPHDEHPEVSRWEYFLNNQLETLPETNYRAILPHIGYSVKTSCKQGYISLNRQKMAIAEDSTILTGEPLIEKMKQIEGKEIEVYWLDSNEGDLIKAIAYCGGRYICEVQPMPKFQRARAEQTEADMVAKALQDAYTMTIVRFVQHHSKQIAEVGIINRVPARKRTFVIPSLKRYEATNTTEVEILSDYDSLDEDDKQILYNPSTGTEYTQSWRNKYTI